MTQYNYNQPGNHGQVPFHALRSPETTCSFLKKKENAFLLSSSNRRSDLPMQLRGRFEIRKLPNRDMRHLCSFQIRLLEPDRDLAFMKPWLTCRKAVFPRY